MAQKSHQIREPRLSELLENRKSPERGELYVLSWVMAPAVVQPVRRD